MEIVKECLAYFVNFVYDSFAIHTFWNMIRAGVIHTIGTGFVLLIIRPILRKIYLSLCTSEMLQINETLYKEKEIKSKFGPLFTYT